MTRLTELNLDETGVTDTGIDGLESLAYLEKLYLGKCPSLSSIRCLGSAKALQNLRLDGDGSCGDPDIVAVCQLRFLSLMNRRFINEVRSLSPLMQCKALIGIHLDFTNVTDQGVKLLAQVPSLMLLGLSGCKSVSDVNALGAARSLTFLRLSGTNVTNECIVGLQHSTSLKELSLVACTSLTDIRCLCLTPGLSQGPHPWQLSDKHGHCGVGAHCRLTATLWFCLSSTPPGAHCFR
jgi:hypothetical protein